MAQPSAPNKMPCNKVTWLAPELRQPERALDVRDAVVHEYALTCEGLIGGKLKIAVPQDEQYLSGKTGNERGGGECGFHVSNSTQY